MRVLKFLGGFLVSICLFLSLSFIPVSATTDSQLNLVKSGFRTGGYLQVDSDTDLTGAYTFKFSPVIIGNVRLLYPGDYVIEIYNQGVKVNTISPPSKRMLTVFPIHPQGNVIACDEIRILVNSKTTTGLNSGLYFAFVDIINEVATTHAFTPVITKDDPIDPVDPVDPVDPPGPPIIDIGDGSTDGIIGGIANAMGSFLGDLGKKLLLIIIASVTLGIIFLIGKVLWKLFRQWLNKV